MQQVGEQPQELAQRPSDRIANRRGRSSASGAEPCALAASDSSALSAVRRLRFIARLRPPLAVLLLAAPTIAVVLQDLIRRGDRIVGFAGLYRWTYLAAMLESAVLWAVLLYAASRRTGWWRWLVALLFVFALTFSVGGQNYFYNQYNAYLNVDVSLFASNFMDSVVNQLFADIANYLWAKTPALIAALALVFLGRRWIRPKRRVVRVVSVAAPAVLVAALFVPTQHRHQQAWTPDMLYLNAVGGLLRTQLGFTEQSNQLRPRSRESLPVPPLSPRTLAQRNVLFIILESVRADAVCVDHGPHCQKTPYSSALTAERVPLTEMRAQASSTAISLAVLWAGVGPTESREVLHTWPLIFDYARAAGYQTAFWTSQNMMFGNARLWVKNLGVNMFCSATDLDPTSDLDMGAPEELLAQRVNAEIQELREPFLAVVQLSNVHYPYLLDADGPQPFQPATTSKAPDVNGSFKNHYHNAVHQQDRHVASIIHHLRSRDFGKRTVIVYTSDHGEAFREHHQMGHTFSVFDEEIKVPAWIDAPPDVLTPHERASLTAKRDAFVFHVDLAPTVLDLIGVLDDPKIGRYRQKMLGSSLLRPELTERALPLTNCAAVWSCAFENWGYMRGPMKLAARSWNEGWECFDLGSDPFERNDLGAAACGDLKQYALRTFERLPGQGKKTD